MLRKLPLSIKFTIVFTNLALLMALAMGVMFRYRSQLGVTQLIMNQEASNIAGSVIEYYIANDGSIDGFGSFFRPAGAPDSGPTRPPRRGEGGEALSPRDAAYGVLDPNGVVYVPIFGMRPRSTVDIETFAMTEPVNLIEIFYEGELIGYVMVNEELARETSITPDESRMLRELNFVIFVTALGAAAIASILGLLFSRYLIRPIQRLSAAAGAISKGDLRQEISIDSEDEIGELARAFNQMSTDLDHANEMRRQLTADIAHDLGTPLQVIAGYIESMRDGVLKPTTQRFDTIYTEIEHLQHLVADLRTLSKAEAGELVLNTQTIQADMLLHRVVNTYMIRAKQAEIDLRLDLERTEVPITVDVERMIQVFGNIVSNAFRYTPEMGQIILGLHKAPDRVVFQIRDTGSGISAEDLPHIFDRFYRADKAREGEKGESGLGLAIAKAIVEAHQGRISATSSGPGSGTTFTIELPAV